MIYSETLKYGNNSRKGDTWISGPTDTLKAQHIPKYAGYIPQINSENIFSNNFARTSAKAINGDHQKGIDPTPYEKYQTEQRTEYCKENFRNLQEETDPAEVKDIQDAVDFHDAEF